MNMLSKYIMHKVGIHRVRECASVVVITRLLDKECE